MLDLYRELRKTRKNVTGVGYGYKYVDGRKTEDGSVVVSVEEKVPAAAIPAKELIPVKIDGVPTDVVQGKFRALEITGRYRPLPAGPSIGHHLVTAGTTGLCFLSADDQRLSFSPSAGAVPVILSNSHVLAMSGDAAVGDEIIQPGSYDNGQVGADTIGHLLKWVPINFSSGGTIPECPIAGGIRDVLNFLARFVGSKTRMMLTSQDDEAVNTVDAALAVPVDPDDVQLLEILGLGQVTGTVKAELGTYAQKKGRTTDHSIGEVTQVDVTVQVDYGNGRIAVMTDQVITDARSAGGDSGSLFVDDQMRAWGLLFAGDGQSMTVANRIENVLEELGAA